MMALITLFSLGIVSVLCAAGALYKHYDDNLFQRIGMAGIGLSCIGLMSHVWAHRDVNNACGLLSVSMAIFAVGVAVKVIQYRPRFGFPEIRWQNTISDEDKNEVHP